MVIVSFREIQLQDFIETGIPPKNCQWKFLSKVVLRKLDMLNYAKRLE